MNNNTRKDMSSSMIAKRNAGVVTKCKKTTCRNNVPIGDIYCSECIEEEVDEVREIKRERARFYNKFDRDPLREKFYQSKEWKKKRKQILQRDNYLCQSCRRKGDVYVPGNIVHHIKELKTHWSLRLADSNLETICQTCHNKEHGDKQHIRF